MNKLFTFIGNAIYIFTMVIAVVAAFLYDAYQSTKGNDIVSMAKKQLKKEEEERELKRRKANQPYTFK